MTLFFNYLIIMVFMCTFTIGLRFAMRVVGLI